VPHSCGVTPTVVSTATEQCVAQEIRVYARET
jgi:hypothetical protein